MSNQVGDCFKFLWPFQNVRTLKGNRDTKTFKLQDYNELNGWNESQTPNICFTGPASLEYRAGGSAPNLVGKKSNTYDHE